jgi:hypothetical protein
MNGELVVPGLTNEVRGAWMLQDRERLPVNVENDDRGAVIFLPDRLPGDLPSVVVLEVDEVPESSEE